MGSTTLITRGLLNPGLGILDYTLDIGLTPRQLLGLKAAVGPTVSHDENDKTIGYEQIAVTNGCDLPAHATDLDHFAQ